MKAFDLYNPTRILFGAFKISSLSTHIPTGSKVMVLYGGGSIKNNGIYDSVITALAEFEINEFSGIEPNPDYQTCIKAIEYIHEKHSDFILAVGGGSVIDAAKFISVGACYTGDPWDILSGETKPLDALPIGTILTLSATGSESNRNAVITRRSTEEKLGFQSDLVRPLFSILDPTTSYSLPPAITSNGVVDAFIHTIEQYLTYPVNAPIQDGFAETLLRTLIEEGPKALKQPENYAVRANIMWAANQALNGLIGAGVPQDWATHMIGHELTALFGIDHARTLAIILPSLLREKFEQKKEKLTQYGRVVWALEGADSAIAIAAINETEQFFNQMGIATHLGDYHIQQSDIAKILAHLEQHRMTSLGEHRDIDLETSRRILMRAL